MVALIDPELAATDELLIEREIEVEQHAAHVAGIGRNAVWGGVSLFLVSTVVIAIAMQAPVASLTRPSSAIGLAFAASSGDDAAETQDEPEADSSDETEAAPPCKMEHADDKPSMFCWSVMFKEDKALITSQFKGRAGIFACNDFMVIGQEDMSLGKDDCGVERKVVMKDLPTVKKGMYGVDGAMTSSWLNVPIFLLCWDTVIESNKVWENDFTVKLDPDTVFFPGRLGYHLQDYVGKPMYTTDCRYWGGDQVGKLFGSIEVVSKQAIGAYKGSKKTCKDLPWQGWGEDYWLQHCMDAIGVTPPVIIADWVGDITCPLAGNPDCNDNNFIANHPHKDAGDWWTCWKASNGE